jgi:hypothetical protein
MFPNVPNRLERTGETRAAQPGVIVQALAGYRGEALADTCEVRGISRPFRTWAKDVPRYAELREAIAVFAPLRPAEVGGDPSFAARSVAVTWPDVLRAI